MPNRFHMSEAEFREWVNQPDGPVAHLLRELADRAAQVARILVPKRALPSPGRGGDPGTSRPPGSTAASIISTLHNTGGSIPWSEVSADLVALWLEKGVQPHWIISHGDWSLSNEETGYFGRVVWHPGTTPRPFLTEGLWSLQGQV